MWLQLNDDGVVEKVDEEHLITVDERELDEFIEKYKKLEKENQELKMLFKQSETKLQKIREYALADGEVKYGVIEKVISDD